MCSATAAFERGMRSAECGTRRAHTRVSALHTPHFKFRFKMVSAAGLAPAIPRFQAEHVAATPHAETPDGFFEYVGAEKHDAENPGNRHRGETL